MSTPGLRSTAFAVLATIIVGCASSAGPTQPDTALAGTTQTDTAVAETTPPVTVDTTVTDEEEVADASATSQPVLDMARSELRNLGCFIDPAQLSALVGFTAVAVPIEERLAGDPAMAHQCNYTSEGYDDDPLNGEFIAMYSTALEILRQDSFESFQQMILGILAPADGEYEITTRSHSCDGEAAVLLVNGNPDNGYVTVNDEIVWGLGAGPFVKRDLDATFELLDLVACSANQLADASLIGETLESETEESPASTPDSTPTTCVRGLVGIEQRGALQFGEDERTVQRALADLGYDPGDIDGYFGENSQRAAFEWLEATDGVTQGFFLVADNVISDLGMAALGLSYCVPFSELLDDIETDPCRTDAYLDQEFAFNPEFISDCVLSAWAQGDRELLGRFAEPNVVDFLFSLGTGEGWTDLGCTPREDEVWPWCSLEPSLEAGRRGARQIALTFIAYDDVLVVGTTN